MRKRQIEQIEVILSKGGKNKVFNLTLINKLMRIE